MDAGAMTATLKELEDRLQVTRKGQDRLRVEMDGRAPSGVVDGDPPRDGRAPSRDDRRRGWGSVIYA